MYFLKFMIIKLENDEHVSLNCTSNFELSLNPFFLVYVLFSRIPHTSGYFGFAPDLNTAES